MILTLECQSGRPRHAGHVAVVTATDNVGVTGLTLTEDGVAVALDASGRATHRPTARPGPSPWSPPPATRPATSAPPPRRSWSIDPQVTGAPDRGSDHARPTTPRSPRRPTSSARSRMPTWSPTRCRVAPVGSDTFTTFFTGTSQVTNGVLGTLDPTMLQNDSYVLRLTATNTGGIISTVDTTVNVAAEPQAGQLHALVHRPDGPGLRHSDHRDAHLRHAHRQRVGRLRLRLAAGVPRRGPAHQRRARPARKRTASSIPSRRAPTST